MRGLGPTARAGVSAGRDPSAGADDRFFFVEADVLSMSQLWTADELLLYLLLCRGYHPDSYGSTYGEKGARERIGMTRATWMQARAALEKRGLIRMVARGKHPVTVLASLKAPFEATDMLAAGDLAAHDGHRWDRLMENGVDVIKFPWRALDLDRNRPGSGIGRLRSKAAMRLILWAYSVAHDDGWIPSDQLWLGGVPVVGCMSRQDAEIQGLSSEEISDAVSEMLRRDLLVPGALDAHERCALHLGYPMSVCGEGDRAA